MCGKRIINSCCKTSLVPQKLAQCPWVVSWRENMRKYIHVYNISSELYANQSALNIRGEDRGFSSCLYEMVYYITFMEEDLQLWYSFVSVNILIEFLWRNVCWILNYFCLRTGWILIESWFNFVSKQGKFSLNFD